MDRLYDYAQNIGVTIKFATGLDPRHPGAFCNHTRHVQVLHGMPLTRTRSTVGHELGHASFEHVPSMFGRLNQKQERIADEWAARFLIPVEDYRLAEEKYGNNTKRIAQELGVLPRLVLAYERTLQRIGDAVYVNPRMGVGNWDSRVDAVA